MHSERRIPQQLCNLACENLRRLFPHSAIVRQLDSLRPAPPVVAKAMATENVRCQERGCVWPAVAGRRRYRQHLYDLLAEASTLPCALGPIVTQLHGHGFTPAPSR
jgi:hypothetical protein